MAMRAAVIVGGTGLRGLRGMLYSSLSSGFPFAPPQTNQINKTPPSEPSTNLFVSGLSKRTTTEKLQEAFAKFGAVVHARVVTDRASGYSKGFGFVRYATLDEAVAGIKGMDGQGVGPFIPPRTIRATSVHSNFNPSNVHGVNIKAIPKLHTSSSSPNPRDCFTTGTPQTTTSFKGTPLIVKGGKKFVSLSNLDKVMKADKKINVDASTEKYKEKKK